MSAETREDACVFCLKSTLSNDELNLGKVCNYENITVHYFCLLLSSNLVQGGCPDGRDGILGFLIKDIIREVKRVKKIECRYCRKPFANIACCTVKCATTFHLPCGIKNGSMHMFYGAFKSMCFKHRKNQIVPKSAISNKPCTCSICLNEVEQRPTLKAIWTPCCQKSWFHRRCVQKMAVNSGYFFKCPLCNNSKEFRKHMLNLGIYIPDQDVSWEGNDSFYMNMYASYSQCDADKCICPKGRKYKGGNRWYLKVCSMCGSNGCHSGCMKKKYSRYQCNDCKAAFRSDIERTPQLTENITQPLRKRKILKKRKQKKATSMSCVTSSEDSNLQSSHVKESHLAKCETFSKSFKKPRILRSDSKAISISSVSDENNIENSTQNRDAHETSESIESFGISMSSFNVEPLSSSVRMSCKIFCKPTWKSEQISNVNEQISGTGLKFRQFPAFASLLHMGSGTSNKHSLSNIHEQLGNTSIRYSDDTLKCQRKSHFFEGNSEDCSLKAQNKSSLKEMLGNNFLESFGVSRARNNPVFLKINKSNEFKEIYSSALNPREDKAEYKKHKDNILISLKNNKSNDVKATLREEHSPVIPQEDKAGYKNYCEKACTENDFSINRKADSSFLFNTGRFCHTLSDDELEDDYIVKTD